MDKHRVILADDNREFAGLLKKHLSSQKKTASFHELAVTQVDCCCYPGTLIEFRTWKEKRWREHLAWPEMAELNGGDAVGGAE